MIRTHIVNKLSIAVLLLVCFITDMDAIAQTTIWSENFENYSDGDVVALDNNTANPSPDWSFGPGSITNKVFGTNPITGNFSFYHRQGTSTWTTESIDISMYTNISVTVNLKEQTCESGDKIETFYSIDGGIPVEFGDGNGDASFNITTNTINNLNGDSLVLSIVTTSDDVDDKHKFDDIFIQGILSTPGVDAVTACDSFTWIDGNTYTSSNNTATDTLVNSSGGDSIVTLNLTILNSSYAVDSITSCGSFIWIDGINYTSSNDSATHILTNADGCDSVITLALTINNVSDISTSVSGITITANNSNASYAWLDCDDNFSMIAGVTNQSFTPSINGNYAVALTENSCVDTSACVVITTVGLIENSFVEEFTLYPNPTNGQFTIEFNSSLTTIELRIMNALGMLLDAKRYDQVDLVEYELNWPNGIYLIEVSDEKNQKTTVRLMKQ